MSTYSVQVFDIVATGSFITGPWMVRVVRNGPIAKTVVAATSGIQTRERAESVARDYRAQFGVKEQS